MRTLCIDEWRRARTYIFPKIIRCPTERPTGWWVQGAVCKTPLHEGEPSYSSSNLFSIYLRPCMTLFLPCPLLWYQSPRVNVSALGGLRHGRSSRGTRALKGKMLSFLRTDSTFKQLLIRKSNNVSSKCDKCCRWEKKVEKNFFLLERKLSTFYLHVLYIHTCRRNFIVSALLWSNACDNYTYKMILYYNFYKIL